MKSQSTLIALGKSASQHLDIVLQGTTTLKRVSTRQDAKPVQTVYQTFYGHTCQHQAVIVRSDGSATGQYPSEGVAVSVDPEQTGKQFVTACDCPSLPVSSSNQQVQKPGSQDQQHALQYISESASMLLNQFPKP